jgi:hypothetical protein
LAFLWTNTLARHREQCRQNKDLVFSRELPGLVGNNDITGIVIIKYSPADGALGQACFRYADAYPI